MGGRFAPEYAPEYIQNINLGLFQEISGIVSLLKKRRTQAQINADLFWLLASRGWFFDSVPREALNTFLEVLDQRPDLKEIKQHNERKHCLSSTTLDTKWCSDFAKTFGKELVQIEAQFGKVEAMFKDFCGFKIAYAEKRLSLGIEIVLNEPSRYFTHRKKAIGGMASFDIAKKTLATISLNCPIWLLGINEA